MPLKRRFKRLALLALAEIKIAGKRAQQKAFVANISCEGIGLYTENPLPVDREVQMILHFVNHKGRKINEKVYGKVVWSEKAYAAGIALKPITPEEHPHLITFVEAFGEEPTIK